MEETKFAENEVIDAIRRAVLAERERCAKVCEAQYEPYNDSYHDRAVAQCVEAIRKGE